MINNDKGGSYDASAWPAPLLRALVAAARTFADELERGLDADLQPALHRPTPGSAASMTEVLGSVARINDELGHGARDEEMRAIAEAAGMDPRRSGVLQRRTARETIGRHAVDPSSGPRTTRATGSPSEYPSSRKRRVIGNASPRTLQIVVAPRRSVVRRSGALSPKVHAHRPSGTPLVRSGWAGSVSTCTDHASAQCRNNDPLPAIAWSSAKMLFRGFGNWPLTSWVPLRRG